MGEKGRPRRRISAGRMAGSEMSAIEERCERRVPGRGAGEGGSERSAGVRACGRRRVRCSGDPSRGRGSREGRLLDLRLSCGVDEGTDGAGGKARRGARIRLHCAREETRTTWEYAVAKGRQERTRPFPTARGHELGPNRLAALARLKVV